MQIPGTSFIGTQPLFPTVGKPGLSGALPGATQPEGGQTLDFGQIVNQAVHKVNDSQQKAAVSIQDLLSGQGDILPVVTEVAKADLSFKMLMAVRNKVIEAYKQTINMQI
jgi:flagellar hook-basal body complex protein FliE